MICSTPGPIGPRARALSQITPAWHRDDDEVAEPR
jgi:hypothetical protein